MEAQLNIRLSLEDKTRLEQIAKERGVSVSELIRNWINDTNSQQTIFSELKELRTYIRTGFNKSLILALKTLFHNNEATVKKEYEETKMQ